ncbi:hypothetical protein TIFTF001_010893 [Ficus carica]|uniref:AD domain-containing protein n=1 Tax=Ficus carica TaxID=3494 RepID=A0AA88AKI9_FICCA|nr:hypothetical protein TIFTF001_010893 [Ficus carica]
MNEVRVGSPYLPESVRGGTPAANDRVKKVIEFERKRLQARGSEPDLVEEEDTHHQGHLVLNAATAVRLTRWFVLF